MASPPFSYLLTYLEARDFSRVRLHESVIPLGTWVYINIEGQGWQKYRAEDTGNGVVGKHIDVAVYRHNETFNPVYNMYSEVRLALWYYSLMKVAQGQLFSINDE